MDEAITIRRSTDRDRDAIARVSALDGGRAPRGEMLLAFVDGELRAAIPLAGGPPVADPFHRTESIVDLLRLRAAQERDGGAPRGGPLVERLLERPRALLGHA